MTVSYQAEGHGTPAVVALHGWGTHSAVWSQVAPELKAAHRMIRVDLPGFGQSTRPNGDYSLPTLAASIVEAVPGPAVWLGWSMGGLVAWEAACRYPEQVTALVIVASTPRFVRAVDWPHALEKPLLDGFAAELERAPRRTLLRFLVLQAGRGAGARAVVKQLRRELFRYGDPDPNVMKEGLAILQSADLRGKLEAIACPTLVILGGRDTLVPAAAAAEIRRLKPEWSVEVIDQSGHAPFLSHPAEFNAILKRFLGALH